MPNRCPVAKKTLSVRQSVTLPANLAEEVRRAAKERHLTTSRALVELARHGIEAEAQARENVAQTYRRFMAGADPERKGEAGKDLIRCDWYKDFGVVSSLRHR